MKPEDRWQEKYYNKVDELVMAEEKLERAIEALRSVRDTYGEMKFKKLIEELSDKYGYKVEHQ